MTNDQFRCLTQAELQPTLDILTGLDWPVAYRCLPEIVERLGWSMYGDGLGHTNLPVSLTKFMAGELEEQLCSIGFRVSDTFMDGTAKTRKIVAGWFPGMMAVVTASVGFGPTRPMAWGNPGMTWDFPNGNQLDLLQDGDHGLRLELQARILADVERDMIRRGDDPEEF